MIEELINLDSNNYIKHYNIKNRAGKGIEQNIANTDKVTNRILNHGTRTVIDKMEENTVKGHK